MMNPSSGNDSFFMFLLHWILFLAVASESFLRSVGFKGVVEKRGARVGTPSLLRDVPLSVVPRYLSLDKPPKCVQEYTVAFHP